MSKVVKRKNQVKFSRNRKWTEEELEQFSIILSSEENCFALALEKLALKKSSNNEVFEHIKKYLDRALKEKEFRTMNEMANFKSKGRSPYRSLRFASPRFVEKVETHSTFKTIRAYRRELKILRNNSNCACSSAVRFPRAARATDMEIGLKDGSIFKYEQLDTSIPKLRKKYTNLKTELYAAELSAIYIIQTVVLKHVAFF